MQPKKLSLAERLALKKAKEEASEVKPQESQPFEFNMAPQPQIIQQDFHDGTMAGISDSLVVEVLHATFKCFTQGAEAARSIKCLVVQAVE